VIRNEKDQVETISLKPKRVSGPQTIGVLLTPNYIKTQNIRSDNPMESARMAFHYTKTLTTETANGLLNPVKQSVSSGNSGGSRGQVSGPIGLNREGSKIVVTKDIQTVLLFAAAISINLGVINAAPLPALDGGQLVFILVEAITRQKIDQKVQEGINSSAVLLLLFVSAEAAIGDIFNIFGK
jgi:RIP metalloprotease RseP